MPIPKCRYVDEHGNQCHNNCAMHSVTPKHIQYLTYCREHLTLIQRIRRLKEKTECQICGKAGTRAEIKNGRCASCADQHLSWKDKSKEDLAYFKQLEADSKPIDPNSEGFQLLLKVLISVCDPEMRLHNRTSDGCKMNGIEIGL